MRVTLLPSAAIASRGGNPCGGPCCQPLRSGHERAHSGPLRQDRQPLQAAGHRFSVGRDLRRLSLHLRLRPGRGPDAPQRQGRLVALHGPAPQPTWSGSTPPSCRRRPSGRPRATWPTSPTPWSTAATAAPATGRTSSTTPRSVPTCGTRGQFTEPRQFNLMFKTQAGPVQDEGAVAYLRPETAQGMFINFANVHQHLAQEAAVRHRPDRQELPQRDHPRQLRVPDPGVRADGAGVLRASRPRPTSGTSTGARSGSSGTSTTGSTRRKLRLRPHDDDELSHYSSGTSDVEFPVPLGLGRAGGHRQPGVLRPRPAHGPLRSEAGVLRPGGQRALGAPRHRAGGRGHPDHDGLPHGRL